ncbi:MAG: 3-oxoacyl-[acyl-carrier protein] reductase [Oceanospirillaceae bacterium]|jgi:3-oxoacyl-[acyl-carrier protein] reductase|tara:strand:- start:21220 stop:22032 length:813 start_codon:yes stop_codon:yes gene_type:complete
MVDWIFPVFINAIPIKRSDLMNVEGKVFVITGGARGLGLAIAQAITSKGGVCALVDLDQAAVDAAASACGTKSKGYACNITQETKVEALFEQVLTDFGRVDGLVNNAGLLRDGMLIKFKDGEVQGKMSLSQWQSVIDVNLTGTFLCGREGAIAMAKAGNGGVIINISSIAKAGNIGQSNYAATKAGVAALVTTWAGELKRFGIRAAGIAPGVICTDMTDSMRPEALERIEKAIPAGRLGERNELANTAMFIIENDYINGRLIELDGGLRF